MFLFPFVLYRGQSLVLYIYLCIFWTLRERSLPLLSLKGKENEQTCHWQGWRKRKAPCPFPYYHAYACAYAYVCASSSSSCAHGDGGDGGHCVWRT